MDGLSSSYSMRHLMGRHYLEHLWVFLSADFFLDVWHRPGPTRRRSAETPSWRSRDPDLHPRSGRSSLGDNAGKTRVSSEAA